MISLSDTDDSNYDLIINKIKFHHVTGKNKEDIKLFALSNCGLCRKTRMFLEEIEIAYDYIYVDLTSDEERNDIIMELKKYNSEVSFPTMVINNNKVIIGFELDEMVDELNI